MKDKNCILAGKHLSKNFGGNVVLKDISIECFPGEGIAIAGENGAGKSTLMNIISGGLKPSAGEVYIDNKKVSLSSSKEGRSYGISFVHQELSLMQEMTVGENIMLGHEPKKGFMILQKELHKQARQILNEVGVSEINAYALVKELSPAEKQIVEITKAWSNHPRIMIFDEPTSSLNKAESEKLFEFIDRIKKQNVCVIVISHRMDDIFRSCDIVIVLKDGEFVYACPVSETDADQIISKMVGREFKNVYPKRNEERSDINKVELKNISLGNKLKNINLEVPKGSVVGIGGLEGQGQRELARGLFGINPFMEGDYLLDGKKVRIKSPVEAVKHKIAFVSDDRKAEGLFLNLSCAENIYSLILSENATHGVVNNAKLKSEVSSGIEQLHIKINNPKQPAGSLSGGNQQKIVFSKWIKTEPELLILHEPTRGIDVQSKLEIYQLIRELTKSGVSVIVFTSDMLELIGLSDEIYIMYEGEISGHVNAADATEESLMRLCAKSGKGTSV